MDENVSFRKIRELDEYKSIFKRKEDRTMLDKVANIVLKKNIKVPEVSLMASEKYFWTATYYHGKSHIKYLDKLKTASFTPDDDDKIVQNLEKIAKLRVRVNFTKSCFPKYQMSNMNITKTK